MDSYSRIPRHSISHDLLTFGHEGLGVNRANERRAAERNRDHITATLRASGTPSSARRWLGNAMIAIGTGIAGKKALAPRPEDLRVPELKYR
jgi:hypothetical protein